MRAGPACDEDKRKRSPTAQQSPALTQVTAESKVIERARDIGRAGRPARGDPRTSSSRKFWQGQQEGSSKKAGGDQRKDTKTRRSVHPVKLAVRQVIADAHSAD